MSSGAISPFAGSLQLRHWSALLRKADFFAQPRACCPIVHRSGQSLGPCPKGGHPPQNSAAQFGNRAGGLRCQHIRDWQKIGIGRISNIGRLGLVQFRKLRTGRSRDQHQSQTPSYPNLHNNPFRSKACRIHRNFWMDSRYSTNATKRLGVGVGRPSPESNGTRSPASSSPNSGIPGPSRFDRA